MVSAVGVAVTHAVVVTHSRVAVVALAAAVVAVGVARASSLAPRCHGNTDTHQHAALYSTHVSSWNSALISICVCMD